MKGRSYSGFLLWAVYALVAAATFKHSAWGFGTLETTSLAPLLTAEGIVFWLTGAMAAAAIDAGMAGLVFAIREGQALRRLYVALGFVMVCSAYTQMLWAVTHAVPITEVQFNVADWLYPVAVSVWVWRVIILPLLLPGLGLLYAFTAKMGRPKRTYKRRKKQPKKEETEEVEEVVGQRARRLNVPPKGDF